MADTQRTGAHEGTLRTGDPNRTSETDSHERTNERTKRSGYVCFSSPLGRRARAESDLRLDELATAVDALARAYRQLEADTRATAAAFETIGAALTRTEETA